ncbi:hypothetical protein MHBO_004516, partial [Bonamia ostreae]
FQVFRSTKQIQIFLNGLSVWVSNSSYKNKKKSLTEISTQQKLIFNIYSTSYEFFRSDHKAIYSIINLNVTWNYKSVSKDDFENKLQQKYSENYEQLIMPFLLLKESTYK